jgi:hypothetical protein
MPDAIPGFSTQLEAIDGGLAGPWGNPRNMLVEQSYGGHASIHDDGMAQGLGFRAAPVEGPTHFSQLAPLGVATFGVDWLARGCVSAHYRSPVFDGERTRAIVLPHEAGASLVEARVVKEDGTEVLQATLSLGAPLRETIVGRRFAAIVAPAERRILSEVEPGMRSPREAVTMPFDRAMGALYPFSLQQKLNVITEPSPWYDPATAESSPWGEAVIPFEMISVLCQATAAEHPFPVAKDAIGLFADQEIEVIDGPLFVGRAYEVEREVVGLSGSRRTESLWISTQVYDAGSNRVRATMLLNQAYLKESIA